jgi:hypothetical protein
MTELYLYGNGLTGTIPSSIGQMTGMTYLSLYVNGLTGKIPSSIGQMTRMTEFDMSENGLTGTIPSSIGQMTSMTYFLLFSNKLSDAVPPLPFAKLSEGCVLGGPVDCIEPQCNQFSCPLPAGSGLCKQCRDGSPGVHCK